MVREGLQAVYGQRLISILVERAMEWKVSTLMSEWKWRFVALTALVATIFVQFFLLAFFIGWITPRLAGELEQQGLPLPDPLFQTIVVADFLVRYQWAFLSLAFLAVFLFERKHHGASKPSMRFAGGTILSLILMVVTSVVSVTHALSYAQVTGLLHVNHPEETVFSKFTEADEAFSKMQQAVEEQKGREARQEFNTFYDRMIEIRYEGSAIPTLMALNKRDEIKEARSTVAEIHNLCGSVLRQKGDLDGSLPHISDAYGRLKEIFEEEEN
ncbi:MAG: hypothetical protein KC964_00380 [Candidatus Omnitrophica bacterium]|nr:hypothetical protein [Candidatus Omnitrophota bacterium]